MSDNKEVVSVSFLEILTLIFIVLKLTGYINWSWWLVLLPILAPLSVAVITVILVACFSSKLRGYK